MQPDKPPQSTDITDSVVPTSGAHLYHNDSDTTSPSAPDSRREKLEFATLSGRSLAIIGIVCALTADVSLSVLTPLAFILALISIATSILSLSREPSSKLGIVGIVLFCFGAGGYFAVMGCIAFLFSGALSQ